MHEPPDAGNVPSAAHGCAAGVGSFAFGWSEIWRGHRFAV